MKIEQEGKRFYLTGNTYPFKGQLKSAGCRWDAARKAWWTGKAQVAEDLAANLKDAPESVGTSVEVRGRARYKDRSYYVVVRTPSRAKLIFRDGSKTFWVDTEKVTFEATYQSPKTIGALQKFAEKKKQEKATGVCQCSCHTSPKCKCGTGFCSYHHDGCDYCGCEC